MRGRRIRLPGKRSVFLSLFPACTGENGGGERLAETGDKTCDMEKGWPKKEAPLSPLKSGLPAPSCLAPPRPKGTLAHKHLCVWEGVVCLGGGGDE